MAIYIGFTLYWELQGIYIGFRVYVWICIGYMLIDMPFYRADFNIQGFWSPW